MVTFGGDALWYIIIQLLRLLGKALGWPWTTWAKRIILQILEDDKSAWDTCWKLIKLPGRSNRVSFRSCLDRILYGLFFFGTFLWTFGIPVLAVFISWALTPGTEENPQVIAANTPGSGALWMIDSNDIYAAWRNEELNLNRTLAAENYFDTCYQSQFFSRCISNLNVRNIPRSIKHNVSCPFNNTVCRQNDTTELYLHFRIETDWITESELGLNSKARYSVRKAVECAPVKTEPFCQNCDTGASDLLFQFGDETYQYHFNQSTKFVYGYRMTTLFGNTFNEMAQIDSRLARADGVTTLLLLAAPGFNYLQPVDDPWFQAHITADFISAVTYQSDYSTTLMGCVDQWQLCNNRTNICSEWQAEGASADYALFDFGDIDELNVGLILYWAFNQLSIYSMVAGRGSNALNVQRSLNGLTQTHFA